MFFFTRKGYLKEIQRLQIALSDAQEAKFKSDEAYQSRINSLLDRIQSLLDPATLREHRRGLRDDATEPQSVPQMLARPKQRRPLVHNPGTKTARPILKLERDDEADKRGVEAVMSASMGES